MKNIHEKMMKSKPIESRILDLKSNVKLLEDSCNRFIENYDFDEIKNIGVRLRVIVGSGKGSGLLFELMNTTKDTLNILALNQYCNLQISEIDNESGEIIQQKEKKSLLTQIPGRLPITMPLSDGIYKLIDLKDWIENGFLIDWDIPKSETEIESVRFTPQYLINRYAGQEAAHSDSTYGTFAVAIETVTMEYTMKNKKICVPIVYEYLYQIGITVAHATKQYLNKIEN